MKVMGKKLALLRLGSYLELIRNCIVGAWDEYNSYPVEHRIKHTTRTRASAIHDHIIFAARRAFDGIQDVRMVEINKLFLIAFGVDIALRFKKLDDSLRSSGIPTQQSIDFIHQGDLPGIPSVTHLEAGYRVNQLGALAGTYICCPNGPSPLWYHEFEGEEDSNVVALPRIITPRGGVQIDLSELNKEGSGEDDDR